MQSTVVVTHAASSIALVTLDAAKGELGIGYGDVSQDLAIGDLIDRASGTIATQCGRVLAKEKVIETFRDHHLFRYRWHHGVDHRDTLPLARFPVLAADLESVTDNDVAVDPADFDLDEEFGIVRRHTGTWAGTVVAIYSGGYVLPDEAPAPLRDACLMLLRERYFARGQDGAISQIRHGDEYVSYKGLGATGAAAQIKDLLTPFRRAALG